MNEYRDGLIDPTMVKRQRVDNPDIINTHNIINSKASIITDSKTIITTDLKASIPVKSAVNTNKKQSLREQKCAAIVEERFNRSLKSNNIMSMLQCLESGYQPSKSQWIHIIGKMHVTTAIKCVKTTRGLDTICITSALRRQHRALFEEVLSRVQCVPTDQIEILMSSPAYYLNACLKKGMDPNIPLKNKRLPLEHACAHSRIALVEILLHDKRTIVSQNVCRFMIR